MDRQGTKQNLHCLAAIAESVGELLIHGIILMMPVGLSYWRRVVFLQFSVRKQCPRNNFRAGLWFE
ncbi:MAG: hypothetical protein CMM01_04855 [Rhodopirellula sp.]|nr:hypothetical protein [Rhodopirellula sp.]